MDGLKGFAEVAKHILYETFGLLIPGGLAAFAVAGVVDPEWAHALLAFARENPWLAVGGAYTLGYLVQAISRPVAVAAEWALRLPAQLLALLGRPSSRVAAAVRGRAVRLDRVLTGRHAHSIDRGQPCVDFDDVIAMYWKRRLGLRADAFVSDAQIRNLSFSQLLGGRDGLDRFRAATSLTRATSAVAAVVLAILVTQIASGQRELTWPLLGAADLLVVAFYGALERADMYDDLWKSSLKTQFLCTVSASRALDPYVAPAPRVEPPAAASEAAIVAARGVALGQGRTREDGEEGSPPSGWEAEREGRGAEPPPRSGRESIATSDPTLRIFPSISATSVDAHQEKHRV